MLPPKVIMSPIDFSVHSDEALKAAADLAAQFGSALCLVHVVPAIPKLPVSVSIFNEGEYEQQLHKDAEKRLTQLAEDLRRKALTVTSIVGTANDVGMEILRIAEQSSADLIVIATHGMTGWHKLAFGSVTEKVVRLATCPVLVLRAQAEAPAEEPKKSQQSVAVAR
ncbi:MAG: universal stress protein [Candidatus Acidiferrales bacterium]